MGAGSKVRAQVSLGTGFYDSGLLSVGIEESRTIPIDENFALSVELVAAGTTLTEAREVDEFLLVGIYDGETWSTSFNPGGGSVIGDGDISLPNGLRLVGLRVPAGVTWTSESGFFPDLPTAAPDDGPSRSLPRLDRNYPNPFNPNTSIPFSLPRPAAVDLRVFDLTGRLVDVLLTAEPYTEGPHVFVWDGRDASGRGVGSGVYLYRLRVGAWEQTKRMTLLR